MSINWRAADNVCTPVHTVSISKSVLNKKLMIVEQCHDSHNHVIANALLQVAKACAEMKGMSELAGGYNAIGFSQGGQFMRVSIESNEQMRMKSEVSGMNLVPPYCNLYWIFAGCPATHLSLVPDFLTLHSSGND